MIIIFIGYFSKAQHYNDSTANILVTWRLPDSFSPEFYTRDDSSLENFQIYRPNEKTNISSSHLGNIGSAYISDDFFNRPDEYNTTFTFNNKYLNYIKTPQNLTFYNTRKPYSSIFYSGSTKINDEQTLDFIHTQNVNPNFNIAVNYRMINSKGQYINQETKLNSISFTSNYLKGRYKMQTVFDYNKFKMENNGGLIDTGNVDINALEANLADANTILNNTDFFISNKYSLGIKEKRTVKDTFVYVIRPSVSFNYNFSYNKKYRIYQDKESFENGYYQNFYYGKDITYDSISVNSLNNTFSFKSESEFVRKNKVGFDFRIKNSIINYYNFNDYIYQKNKSLFIQNNITGTLFKNFSKSGVVEVYADYFITGYRKNDYRAQFLWKKIFGKSQKAIQLYIFGTYTNHKPDYFVQNFYSNHFRWENNFDNTKTANAKLQFTYPAGNFYFEANNALIDNYVYFGALATPSQFDQYINVVSLKVAKSLNFGNIHFYNQVIWQKSSNIEILDLPQVTLFNSTSIELNYKSALKLFLGFDIHYMTKFNAFSYNPGVGQFYVDNGSYTGNYPFGSVYVKAKIKKNVFVFTKLEHFNSGIFLEKYTSVSHYPINLRMFILGVKWTFNN